MEYKEPMGHNFMRKFVIAVENLKIFCNRTVQFIRTHISDKVCGENKSGIEHKKKIIWQKINMRLIIDGGSSF